MFIIFISLLFLFLLLAKKESILILFVFLIPFHSFLKAFSDFYFKIGYGNIFAFWKEFAILIFAIKVFRNNRISVNKTLLLCLYIFVFITILFFTFSDDYEDGLAHLRDHIFSIVLFIALASSPITNIQIIKLLRVFLIGGLISCIAGFLQYYFFKIPIGFIMKSIDFIDANGYVQYNYNSFRIMGFERMSGILTGPNDFGLYCSFILVLSVFLLNMKKSFTKGMYFFILTTTVLSATCLILSFSRVGWVIAVICIAYMIARKIILLKTRNMILFGVVALFLVLVLGTIFPSSFDIITNTLTGKEASAANRGSEINEGLSVLFAEPLGHGLGTADIRSSGRSFSVESIFLNTAYEIGVLGLALLIFIHIYIIRLLFRRIKLSPLVALIIALSIAALISSFASVNTYGVPFIYIWWFMLGIGVNKYNTVFNNRLVAAV